MKTMPKLVKDLDKVYSQYIRLSNLTTDGEVMCVSCGKTGEWKNLQNGHYISRSCRATRWLDENCHPQCYRCNVALKGNYPAYTLYMTRKYGDKIIEELVRKSHQTYKLSRVDMEEKILQYKELVKELAAKYNITVT